ncbi:MAG TPA: hypothetical protein VIV58_15315 [Kofleriaceae bacterium]
MRSLALVLCLCTGCDRLFDLHQIPLAPDARGSDAGHEPDAGMAGAACSQMSMLADDFSTDDLKTTWPASGVLDANLIAVSNGQVLIENLSANSYAKLDPGRYYDLRESSFSASITDDGHMDADDYVLLELDSEIAGYGLQVKRDATLVQVTSLTPQQPPLLIGSFAYAASSTAYLRAGVSGGRLVLDSSADGVQWSPRTSVANAVGYTFVHPWIQTHRGAASQPFTVFVDDVNGGTPSGAACSITQLHDDFSGSKLGDAWARSPQVGGTISVANGVADVTSTGTNSLVVLGASTVYDLQNGAVFAEIPVMIANASQNTVAMSVTTGAGDTVTISQTNGIVTTSATIFNGGGATTGVTPYDPVAMRWWRIQNTTAGTGWAFSPDGVTWTAQPTTVHVTGIDRSDVGLAVVSNTGSAGDTRIDNVNVPAM